METALENYIPLEPRALMLQLGLSLLLGMLVGLQREKSKARFGMRTFSLITILGTCCAFLSIHFGLWILATGLFSLALIGISAVGFSLYHRQRSRIISDQKSTSNSDTSENNGVDIGFEFGTTTLITTLVMYCVGAMLANPKWTLLALEIGGITAVLLQFKLELHHVANLLGEDDMRAIMQFVMITFVILPVLPNKCFGPYDSFNPFEIWLMVVLIIGMNLSGYIAYKFFGERAGILLGGVLGGAISSTATAVCYSKQVATKLISNQVAALVIVISSAFIMIRTMIMIGVISPTFLGKCFLPLTLFGIISCMPVLFLYFLMKKKQNFNMVEQTNPTQWRSALSFACLYAVISFAMKAGSTLWGDTSLCWIAAVSGFTETSAVTISTTRLALTDPSVMISGWKLILIATMSNYLFKWIMILLIAGWTLGMEILLLFAFPILGGLALFLFF